MPSTTLATAGPSTMRRMCHQSYPEEVVGTTTPETACYGAQRRAEKNAFLDESERPPPSNK